MVKHRQAQRESLSRTLVAVWITFMGISSGFSLTNHLALSGPESVFGLSQGSPVCVCVCVCVCASLSQDGFQQRGLQVVESLTMRWQHPLSFDLQGAFLCMCSQGGLLDFKNEKYVVFYLLSWQGPESSINPAFMGFLLLWNFCPRGESVQPGAYLSSSFFFFFFLSIFYLNTYSSHLLYPFIWDILSCFFTCL